MKEKAFETFVRPQLGIRGSILVKGGWSMTYDKSKENN
jgi:hypothetical protein